MDQLKDELNPKFIFSDVHTNLLIDAINGKINLLNLAMNELVNRGLNDEGQWIGFDNSRELFELKMKGNKK